MGFGTTIYFVRHGHVYNPQDVFYGRLPGFRLSGEGCRQARTTAELLNNKPLTAAFSSPLLRARQTTEIILASRNNLALRISQDLNEAYTPFDGYPISEMISRNWDVYTGTDPKYEQPNDILKRVQDFVSMIRQLDSGHQHILAVTHGDVVALARLWVNGIPITLKNKQDNYPAPASVTTLTFKSMDKDEIPGYRYAKPYS